VVQIVPQIIFGSFPLIATLLWCGEAISYDE